MKLPDFMVWSSGFSLCLREAKTLHFSLSQHSLKAVNLGDDADTTGAIYGQIAGAFYGEEGIPEAWRNRVVCRDVILHLANNIFQAAHGKLKIVTTS
jgi:ADP-ribosylglycohydrolase